MEKLYTVEDIAQMTSMTTRTIRNYLKEGLLKGKKIGGQWRFTQGDVENFMDNGAYRSELTSRIRQDIIDFVDGVNIEYTGEVQSCVIVDSYLDRDVQLAKRDKLQEFINSEETANRLKPNFLRYTWEYIEEEAKGRTVLFAPPHYLLEALKIIQ